MIARFVDGHQELKVVQSVAKTGMEEGLVLIGDRIPPIPGQPVLSCVRFGEPILLFNGRDLLGRRSGRDRHNQCPALDTGEDR